jgi:hypothetical protein
MKRSFCSVLLFCSLFFLLVARSSADPIPLSAGRPLQALQKTQVQIVQEDLSIQLTLDRMSVRAVFQFKNPDGKTSFPVGFPCEPALADMTGMSCEHPLIVMVQGKALKTEIKSVKDYGRCWVWDMRLDKEAQARLELEYSAPIVNDRYQVPFAGVWFIYYPLRTGANWAGPIERLNIAVTMPVETIIRIGPPGYSRKAGRVEWHLSEWKPQEDLFIVLDPEHTSRYLAEILSNKNGADDNGKRLMHFAASFLADSSGHLRYYANMDTLFRGFNFPSIEGVKPTVKESFEIMRQAAQKQ